MIKSRLEVMEDVHNNLAGAIIGIECELEMLEPKIISVINPQASLQLKQVIAQKKESINNIGEIMAILEDKIEVEKKKK
jgi:hypothetical protein